MEAIFYSILFVPLLAGLAAIFFKEGFAKTFLKINIGIYVILSALVGYMQYAGIHIQNSFFALDHINVPFFALIITLSALISLYAIKYFKEEVKHGVIGYGRLKQYSVFINLFVFCMLLVATSINFVVMWIGIEATTIFTIFLISFYNTKTSRDAAWTYIILCGIGLIIGLLGVMMMTYAGLPSMDWQILMHTDLHSLAININLVKFAFLFILVGFGTKVGFFPMNSWLPEAHGKGSTPISAFMSSILLPLAFYIILRAKFIVDQVVQGNFANTLLVMFGLVTIVYAGFALLYQRHFKKALAYSSSENMGIIAFAFGLGTHLATIFAYLHIIGHSFLKTASFMSVGNVLLFQGTGKFSNVSHLTRYMKFTSIFIIISLLLLVGLPPSPLFFSELGIILESSKINIGYTIIFILGLILSFTGLLNNFSRIFGNRENDAHQENKLKEITEDSKWNVLHVAITLTLLSSLIISLVYSFKYLM